MALPVCLGPLRHASKFVLVGDQYQLPPLFGQLNSRVDPEPSLFKILSEFHPEATVALTHQYRMNAEIMYLTNHLIYDFKLQCGSMEVAKSRLRIPTITSLSEHLHISNYSLCSEPCWISKIIEPEYFWRKLMFRMPVVFADTDGVPCFETRKGPILENAIEADLVYQTVKSLILSGVSQCDIGVMSPYRKRTFLLTDRN